MSNAPLIIVCPNNTVQIVIQPFPTITTDTVQKDVTTMVEDTMSHSIKLEETHDATDVLQDVVDTEDSTAHTLVPDATDTLETYESMMQKEDVPLKKKKYVRKRSLCPIAGCTKNKKPLILSVHLLRHHKISREERMYWLKNQ